MARRKTGRQNVPSTVKRNILGRVKTPITTPIPKAPINIPIINKIANILALPKTIPVPKPRPTPPFNLPKVVVNPPIRNIVQPISLVPKTKRTPKVTIPIGRGQMNRIPNIKSDRGFEEEMMNPIAVDSTRNIIVGRTRSGREVSAMEAIRGGGIPIGRGVNRSRVSTKEGLRAFDETDRRVRGVPGDRAFDDEVNRAELGLPIVGGDSIGGGGLILAKEAIPPMPPPPGDPIGPGKISFSVTSEPGDASVFINGKNANVKATPTSLTFKKKELLGTNKVITVKRAGYENSGLTYTISAKMKTITKTEQVLVDDPIDILPPDIRRGDRAVPMSYMQAAVNPFMEGRFSQDMSGRNINERANIIAGQNRYGGPVRSYPTKPRYRTVDRNTSKLAISYYRQGGGLPNQGKEFLDGDGTRPTLHFPLSKGVKDDPKDDPTLPTAFPELLILTENDGGSTDLY